MIEFRRSLVFFCLMLNLCGSACVLGQDALHYEHIKAVIANHKTGKTHPWLSVYPSLDQAKRCFGGLSQAVYERYYPNCVKDKRRAFKSQPLTHFQQACRNWEWYFEQEVHPMPKFFTITYNDDFKCSKTFLKPDLPGDESLVMRCSVSYRSHFFNLHRGGSTSPSGTRKQEWVYFVYLARKGSVLARFTQKIEYVKEIINGKEKVTGTDPDKIYRDTVKKLRDALTVEFAAIPELSAISDALQTEMKAKLPAGKSLCDLTIPQVLQLLSKLNDKDLSNLRERSKPRDDTNQEQTRRDLLARRLQHVTSGCRIEPSELRTIFWDAFKKRLSARQMIKKDRDLFMYLREVFFMRGYLNFAVFNAVIRQLDAGEKPQTGHIDQLLTLANNIGDWQTATDWNQLLDALGVPRVKTKAERCERLDIDAASFDVRPDGKSTIAIRIANYTYIPGDPGSRQPIRNRQLAVTVDKGRLSADRITTNPLGEAQLTYTAPAATELTEGCSDCTLTVDTINGLKEHTYIHFVRDHGKVNVRPHFGKGISNTGVIPADKRFPATIHFRLSDRDGKAIVNEQVTFELKNGHGRLEHGQETGSKLQVTTDAEGEAVCDYRYTGPGKVRAPDIANVAITSEHQKLPVTARIEAGIDLAVTSAQPHVKGELSAGETVPLAITVCDRFHGNRDVAKLLNHWRDDPKTGQARLWMNLELRPAGNIPKYFSDLIALHKQSPIATFAWPMALKAGGRSILMIEGTGHMQLPSVKLGTSGQNLFDLKVQLGTNKNGQFQAIEEQWPNNNKGFIVIPAGVRADAGYIWLVENPFGGHTESARLLRAIAGLHNVGESVLNLADTIAAINRGDLDDLTALAVSQVKSKCISHYAGKYKPNANSLKDAVVTSAALAHTQTAASIALLAELTPADDKTADAITEEAIVSSILKVSRLKDHKLIILHGNGKQELQIQGKAVPVSEDHVVLQTDGQTISALRCGGISAYCIPKNAKVQQTNSTKMNTYK